MASTRNSLSPYVDFPLLDLKDWVKSQHLLSWDEVIGGVRSLVCRRVYGVEAWKPGVEACLFHLGKGYLKKNGKLSTFGG